MSTGDRPGFGLAAFGIGVALALVVAFVGTSQLSPDAHQGKGALLIYGDNGGAQ